jgi:hypothetical protein
MWWNTGHGPVRPGRAVLVFVAATLLGALACDKRPIREGTGVVTDAVKELPELGGAGVWIRHDGLSLSLADGGVTRAEGMRAPFGLAAGVDRGLLVVGRKLAFRFRENRRHGPPFELVDVRPVP